MSFSVDIRGMNFGSEFAQVTADGLLYECVHASGHEELPEEEAKRAVREEFSRRYPEIKTFDISWHPGKGTGGWERVTVDSLGQHEIKKLGADD